MSKIGRPEILAKIGGEFSTEANFVVGRLSMLGFWLETSKFQSMSAERRGPS
jgi:hypothetical protein